VLKGNIIITVIVLWPTYRLHEAWRSRACHTRAARRRRIIIVATSNNVWPMANVAAQEHQYEAEKKTYRKC